MPARIVKPSKYRNRAVTHDGIRFASQREGNRYLVLKAMLERGEIVDLELQPPFPIVLAGKHICTYKADFAYLVKKTRLQVIEDAKGFKTPVYKLKKRLVEALYAITITEV